MQDSKKQEPDKRAVDADATSKQTLSDLEKDEQSSGLESEGTARESDVASPDGALDEASNKTDDAGPM